MLGVYEIRRLNLIKIVSQLKNISGINRAEFANELDKSYSLLNQYLSPNIKKNIGTKFADEICNYLKVQPNWLDHLHDDIEVIAAIRNMTRTTQNDAQHPIPNVNLNIADYKVDALSSKMTLLTHKIEIKRGKELSVSKLDKITASVISPVGMQQPIAYLIDGNEYPVPYQNGHVILCDASLKPELEDQVIVQYIKENKTAVVLAKFKKITFDQKLQATPFDGSDDVFIDLSAILSTHVVVSFVTPRGITQLNT